MDQLLEVSKAIVEPISEMTVPVKIEADHDAFENFMNSFQENSIKFKDVKKETSENYYNLDIGTEHLILVMERHPSLWDPRHIDYPNKQKRDTEWIKVADELLPNWNFLNETQDVLREIKKRWRNTRDSYKKDQVNRNNCDDPSRRKRRRYIFSKQLSFLDPVLEFKEFNRMANSAALPNVSTQLDDVPMYKMDGSELDSSPVRSLNLSEHNAHDNHLYPERKLQAFNHFLTTRKKYPSSVNRSGNSSTCNLVASTSHSGQKVYRADDEDLYFLLSLTNDFKKVPDTHKLQLKTDMLVLIQKYQNLNLESLNVAATSNYINGFDFTRNSSAKCYSSSNSSTSESVFAVSNDEQ